MNNTTPEEGRRRRRPYMKVTGILSAPRGPYLIDGLHDLYGFVERHRGAFEAVFAEAAHHLVGFIVIPSSDYRAEEVQRGAAEKRLEAAEDFLHDGVFFDAVFCARGGGWCCGMRGGLIDSIHCQPVRAVEGLVQ